MFGILSTLYTEPEVALLDRNTFELSKRQFKLLMDVTTAAKQTLAKARKTPNLCLTKTGNRVSQVMIHGKIEVTLQDRISAYSKM